MKKLLLILISTVCVNYGFAQTAGKQAHYIYDDFATTTEYSGTGGTVSNPDGIYWFPKPADSDPNYSVDRPGDGQLHVAVTNATNYVPFGITFGDDNGAAAGGNSYIEDFGNNMDIYFDITNQNSTPDDSAYITFQFQDSLGGVGEYFPDTSAVTSNWGGPRKMKMGFLLLPGETQSVHILASNVPNRVGGLKATGYDCNSPLDCPSTTYVLNPAKITKLLIFVNGDASEAPGNRVYPNISPYNGTLLISNFKIGDITTGVNKASVVVSDSKLFPNPTSDLTHVSLNLKSASDVKVTLTDVLGRQVDAITSDATSDFEGSFNVASLPKGIYTVNYYVNGQPAKAELLLVK